MTARRHKVPLLLATLLCLDALLEASMLQVTMASMQTPMLIVCS